MPPHQYRPLLPGAAGVGGSNPLEEPPQGCYAICGPARAYGATARSAVPSTEIGGWCETPSRMVLCDVRYGDSVCGYYPVVR
eukprot:1438028-Rhodomonas_salina.2